MRQTLFASAFFISIWLGCLCTLHAQPVQRNLLSHFSEEDLAHALIPLAQWHPFPQTAKEWNEILPDTVRENIIRRAEQYAAVPFEPLPASLMLEFVRIGDRKNYETVSFQKRDRLFALSLAESVEQKGRFLEAIMNGVWSICEESFWGIPAHLGAQKASVGLADVEDPTVDLFAAETAAALALTDYLAGRELDTISPLLRKRIYWEVNRRVLTPLEKDSKRYWYFGDHPNNWNPWITSNWMISLLLLEKNEKRRAAELHHAMVLTDIYVNSIGDDGAIDEGPAYWFDAVGRLFVGLNIINRATANSVNIFNDPFLKSLASYIYKTHISGDYFISVADASPVLQPDGLMLYRFGIAVNDTTLQNFGAYFFQKKRSKYDESFAPADQLWNFTAIKNCSKVAGSEPLLSDVWLKSIQLMTARTNDDLFVASHGGHNGESHNHNDVGDVIIYVDGEPVIIDVGSGTYTAKTFSKDRYTLWYNTSAYHNLPLVNGFQQKEGRQFEAKDVKYTEGPSVSELQMNIAPAYPADAGIKQWTRKITAEKKTNRVVVKDDYSCNNALKQLTQTFMTVCTTDIQQPGKIFFDVAAKKVLMEYDAEKWSVTKEEVLKHSPDEKRLEDNWSHRPVWRLLLTCEKFSDKGSFTYTFREVQ